MTYQHGIDVNRVQFAHQLLQVLLVGLTLGLMRTVVPALAESEFGVPKGSFMLLMAFVVAFGFVKGTLNFIAGRLSERLGRKTVLLIGWLVALPIPFMILYAPTWNWVVAATVLLGVNQGLTWSVTQTSKLDLAHRRQRGLAIGLDEFSGYFGVALGGVLTAYLATSLGAREGLLYFGLAVLLTAIALTIFGVRETLPWARAEGARQANDQWTHACLTQSVSEHPSAWEIFTLMSWRNRCMFAFCQAGLVEKFVDALVWVFYPVYLYQQGLSLARIGWVVGAYGFVWGLAQLFTGRLSDRIGRKRPIVWGMWLCGAGVGLTLLGEGLAWWSFSAALTGFGMALLYPNLSAAIGDIAHPNWRGTAIGIYRFWRDLGYGIGALALGAVGYLSGTISAGFWFVAISMALSGWVVWQWGIETHHVPASGGRRFDIKSKST